jgi:hypothetical protein
MYIYIDTLKKNDPPKKKMIHPKKNWDTQKKNDPPGN